MKPFIIAAVAGFTVSAFARGGSQVINACEAQVSLCAVPAYGESQELVMKTGDHYFHQWEALSSGGWSIKLYPLDGNNNGSNITQYEWNMDDGVTIWWDMSDVNGCPFGNVSTGAGWLPYTSSDSCSSVQKSYQYSTNDIAMQAPCYDQEANITILLCHESDAAKGLIDSFGLKSFSTSGVASSSIKASSSATSSPSGLSASSTTSVAATPAQTTHSSPVAAAAISSSSSSTEAANTHNGGKYNNNNKTAAVSATTLSTTTSAVITSTEANGVVIVTKTQVYTQNVDEVVTVTQGHRKRHEHRHPHRAHHAISG